jgi:hypothetical protein
MEGRVVDHVPEPAAPTSPPLRGNAALRSRLQTEPPPEPPPEEDEPEEDDSPAPDSPAQPSAPVQAATPGAEVTSPAATRRRRRQPEPTEAEIVRSQEALSAVLGPEEVAWLDEGGSVNPDSIDPDPSVFVPFDAAGNPQEWFGRARERLREMQQARLTPDRFVAYRKANAGPLMRLQREFASYHEQLDGIIAAGERGGASLGFQR